MNGAIISPCGRYRTLLWRTWQPELLLRMLLVMLNPSTADASLDDPTLRRGIAFARREGCGGMDVVNLYDLRTPSPAVLKAQGYASSALNGSMLRAQLALAGGPIVCGWGVHARASDAMAFRAMAAAAGQTLYHLGLNANGSPKHPLYLRANAPLTEWIA